MISDIEVINMLVGIYLTYMGIKDLRYGKVDNEITIVFIALCSLKFFFVGDFSIYTISYKLFTILSLLAFYYISKGKVGGADIKILIGLAIALNVYQIVSLILLTGIAALCFVGASSVVRRKITTNVKLVPFMAIGYLALLTGYLFFK